MKLGKQTKINIEASRKIKQMWISKDIKRCEVVIVPNCTGTWALTPAHRHKRLWYYRCPDKLSDFKQVIRACTNCHQFIENKPILTEETFLKLRGPE